jgi:cytochrome c553
MVSALYNARRLSPQSTCDCACKMNKLLRSVSLLVVACVVAAPSFAQDVKADASAGEKKNAMCVGCHGIAGYSTGFPEVHKVPKISGQGAKYIVAALNAYKKGERKNPTMRGIAESLNQQDIADLAAYYQASGAMDAAPVPAKAVEGAAKTKAQELLTKGGCVSCHGDNLSKPIDPSYPKIAGQHGDYLYVALKAYKTENNPMVGRNNPIMGGMVKQFSNAELKELANYIGGLPGDLKTIQPSRLR